MTGEWGRQQSKGLCKSDRCCRWSDGRERDNEDLLSCSRNVLEGPAAGCGTGAVPHSDAVDGASAEGGHDGGQGSESPALLRCFQFMQHLN